MLDEGGWLRSRPGRLNLGIRWTVLVSKLGGVEIFRTLLDRPWADPASYKMGTGYLSRA
jgi:hypothetical protein